MIELEEIKNENENDINNIKEEKKEVNRSLTPKKNKLNEKSKKDENKKIKININMTVNDINNMILMQTEQNNFKFYFFCVIIYLTLQFTNANFLFFLGYLRPTLIVNKYHCYNSVTRHYQRCLTDNFCSCNHDYCVTFCYEEDYSKCPDIFNSQNEELIKNKLINIPRYLRSLDSEYKIIYPMEKNENVSIFQKIGYYYCYLDLYSLIFISIFVLGCCLGYYIFGLISDLYGRKKSIIILCISTLISNGGIMIISNFALYESIDLLSVLWIIFILLLGATLEPLESALYVYFMEMFRSKVLIKPVSSLLFLRYFVSLAFLCFFNYYLKNLTYIFYFFEAYIFIFIFIMAFIFQETPRFFSERQDNINKSMSFFLKDYSVFIFKENENDSIIMDEKQQNQLDDNQRNSKSKIINYSYLYSKFKANQNISKFYYIILFCSFILNFFFYTILLKFIYFFLDPHNEFSLSTFLGVFIPMILFYAIMQIALYFLLEIFSLNIIISALLLILFFCGLFFDIGELKPDSYRKKLFFPELAKKNKHLLSSSLFFIVYIISIYEMMLIFLSPTLYRTYFFFCQKGISFFSLILAFLSVYAFNCPIFFISIISFFFAILFLTLRVKWEKISLKEEINRKLKNL